MPTFSNDLRGVNAFMPFQQPPAENRKIKLSNKFRHFFTVTFSRAGNSHKLRQNGNAFSRVLAGHDITKLDKWKEEAEDIYLPYEENPARSPGFISLYSFLRSKTPSCDLCVLTP